MNPFQTLLVPLVLIACLAAGFIIYLVRHAGWRRAMGWLVVITAAALGSSTFITQISIPWNKLLHGVATLLPLCAMMIPLLGMLVLAWLTGAQLASGIILLTKQFTQ